MVYVLDIDTYIFIYIYMIYISFIRYMYIICTYMQPCLNPQGNIVWILL